MKWYFAYNAYTESTQFPLIRMAVNSARHHTDLEPHCIVSGPPGECAAWLESRGVTLHRRDIAILDALERYKAAYPQYDMLSARGAYLRLEIGAIEQTDRYVLYTDTDVMFRSLDGLRRHRPWIVAIAPEFDLQNLSDANTGVMVINVRRFRRWVERIYEHALRDPSKMLAHDQTAIVQVLGWRWQRLRPEFNWKPYWGHNAEARIIHWHGPKPAHAQQMLDGGIDSMPEPYQHLFRLNPDGYRDYLAMAREFAGE